MLRYLEQMKAQAEKPKEACKQLACVNDSTTRKDKSRAKFHDLISMTRFINTV